MSSGAHDPDCVFCKIVRGEIPSKKVYEDEEVLAFHDLHPVAPVHFLIIPKTHVASLYGAGSGASHLVCGHSALHQQLEEALAEFTGRPRALLFSSGYMANTGILTSLLQRGDHVLEDRLNHASLLDGGLHSGARFQRYAHCDAAALERAQVTGMVTLGQRKLVAELLDLAVAHGFVLACEVDGAMLYAWGEQ